MNPQFSNFTPPVNSSTGNKTLLWFRVYCIVLSLIYVLVTFFGIYLAVAQPQTRQYEEAELFFVGIIYAILGVILFLVFVVGVIMPPRRWSWVYGMVLICIGMTSCCFLPATIPLLIFWLKPETKTLFGR